MATLTSSLIVQLINRVGGPARAIQASLGRIDTSIRRNDAALARARGGMFDAAAGFYALQTAIASPVREAMRFESAMADVIKVVDFANDQALEDFRSGLIALSKEVPISVNGLAAIAAAAGQAGIAGDDLNRFTETAAKVGVAFDISADQAGEAMAKLMTGLSLSIDEVTLLSDAMNHLSNSQASSAAEILDVVRRVGAQGKQFGFQATEVAAFASAMIAAGATSDVAATSFRNMGRSLTMGGSATKRVRNGLAQLGLEAEDVARRMQEDAVGTTVDVLERISRMPAEMQAALSTDIFGSEARALGPLLTNLDLVNSSLGLVSDQSKFAGSAFKEFEVRSGTFENALQIFNNRLSAMKVVIGAALIPAINSLMESLVPVIDAIGTWAAQNPELVSQITQIVAGLVAFKGATAALRFVGLVGKGGALSLLATGLRVALGAFRAFRTAVMFSGVGLALTAVASAGNFIYSNFKGLKAMFEGIGSALSAAFEPAGPWLEKVRDTLSGIYDWLTELTGKVDMTEEQWRNLGESIGTSIADAVKSMKQSFDDFIAWLRGIPARAREAIGSIDLRNLIKWPEPPDWMKGSGETTGSIARREGRRFGGPVLRGGSYVVGEDGPERITVGDNGFVNTARETMRALQNGGGAGAGKVVSAPVSIQGPLTGPITIASGEDPRVIAEQIGDALEQRLSAAMREVYAD